MKREEDQRESDGNAKPAPFDKPVLSKRRSFDRLRMSASRTGASSERSNVLVWAHAGRRNSPSFRLPMR